MQVNLLEVRNRTEAVCPVAHRFLQPEGATRGTSQLAALKEIDKNIGTHLTSAPSRITLARVEIMDCGEANHLQRPIKETV